MASFAIGVDVGGSFTDVVLSTSDRTVRAKAPTDPADIGNGVMEGCKMVASQVGLTLRDLLPNIARFGLGTTAVTNALTAHKGLKVGLITTAGFESLALTARGDRVCADGWLEVPWIPIESSMIAGVPERVDCNGKVLVPLSADAVLTAARELVEAKGAQAIAISFLWSFLNLEHEEAAKALVQQLYPELPVFCGAELQPVQREYERTTVAIMNAFCADALDGMESLEQRLKNNGLSVPLLLLQASGGTISVAEARRTPLRLAASGPAAGVVAAAELAATKGISEAVCGDMGGTSFDVAVITGGMPVRAQRGKLHGVAVAQSHVEVESVGSGGGSIAWVDKRGMLRVGPQSARSFPGPACYGRGGTEPTITDAMVLLGYLDPAKFLGGSMKLDLNASEDACARLGESLGLDAMETAWGIREMALADMASAMRSRISSSGLEPAQLAAITYGGSGSLFMAPIAHSVGVKRLLVPVLASVLSAFGGGSADIRLERSRSVSRLLPLDGAALRGWIDTLKDLVEQDLAANGVAADARELCVEADMRFRRQTFELSVPVTLPLDQERLVEEFRRAYVAIYGTGTVVMGAEVELATIRVIGIGRTERVKLFESVEVSPPGRTPPSTGTRRLRLERETDREIPVYNADDLLPGDALEGPALIDAVDNTLWIPPDCTADVDRFRTITVLKKG